MATLSIKSGPLAGKKIPLSGSSFTLGRAPDNDLVLTDDLASRHHARLLREGASWAIEDLGSRNGLTVNQLATPRARLANGDLIQIGHSAFLFEDPPAAPLPSPVEVWRGSAPPAAAPAEAGRLCPGWLPALRRRWFWGVPLLLLAGYLAYLGLSRPAKPRLDSSAPALSPPATPETPVSRRDRKQAKANFSKGLFNLQIGDRKKALDFFRQAYALDSAYPAARVKIDETMKELRQEIEDLLLAGDRELERLQPDFANLEYQRALSLARDFDPALEARAAEKIRKAQARKRELEQSDAQNQD